MPSPRFSACSLRWVVQRVVYNFWGNLFVERSVVCLIPRTWSAPFDPQSSTRAVRSLSPVSHLLRDVKNTRYATVARHGPRVVDPIYRSSCGAQLVSPSGGEPELVPRAMEVLRLLDWRWRRRMHPRMAAHPTSLAGGAELASRAAADQG